MSQENSRINPLIDTESEETYKNVQAVLQCLQHLNLEQADANQLSKGLTLIHTSISQAMGYALNTQGDSLDDESFESQENVRQLRLRISEALLQNIHQAAEQQEISRYEWMLSAINDKLDRDKSTQS